MAKLDRLKGGREGDGGGDGKAGRRRAGELSSRELRSKSACGASRKEREGCAGV